DFEIGQSLGVHPAAVELQPNAVRPRARHAAAFVGDAGVPHESDHGVALLGTELGVRARGRLQVDVRRSTLAAVEFALHGVAVDRLQLGSSRDGAGGTKGGEARVLADARRADRSARHVFECTTAGRRRSHGATRCRPMPRGRPTRCAVRPSPSPNRLRTRSGGGGVRMNQKKIVITAVAALIAFAAGYGLLGMAAPDASGAQTTDVVPDATL